MNKLINICLLAVFLAGCGPDKKETDLPPVNLMADTLFVKLLGDFALAESASNMNILNVPAQKIDSVYAFNPLKENNVRKSQYDSTIKYYSDHPEVYKKIYESVIEYLTEFQAKRAAKADTSHQ